MTGWTSTSEGDDDRPAWDRETFERKLREQGRLYHLHHPYQKMMARGELNREQIQGWVINRFYYQISIPRKDAAILANCPDRETRRIWIKRILDHDGAPGEEGGIEAWLALGEACGVSRERMLSLEEVLPGVRFAVDAYVNFARTATWQEAACSSLTELFAPGAHQSRLDTWPKYYPWVDISGLRYFEKRLSQAREDVQHGLAIALDHFRDRASQEHAMRTLRFKLDVLWTMLDAMYLAYVVGMPPYAAVEDTDNNDARSA